MRVMRPLWIGEYIRELADVIATQGELGILSRIHGGMIEGLTDYGVGFATFVYDVASKA